MGGMGPMDPMDAMGPMGPMGPMDPMGPMGQICGLFPRTNGFKIDNHRGPGGPETWIRTRGPKMSKSRFEPITLTDFLR